MHVSDLLFAPGCLFASTLGGALLQLLLSSHGAEKRWMDGVLYPVHGLFS